MSIAWNTNCGVSGVGKSNADYLEQKFLGGSALCLLICIFSDTVMIYRRLECFLIGEVIL